ncbi:MAG: hypothetical protein GX759_06540 [Thermoanaerobacterales bacterium]|nr:hypothetical protein [Thermoanaerobacterales bacterium]
MGFKKVSQLFVTSCLGALILILVFNNTRVNVSGVELIIGLKPALKGFTSIILPPLGNVKAYTHGLPIKLSIELKTIDINLLKSIIDKAPDKNELWTLFWGEIINSMYLLGLKTMILGAVGALVTAFAMRYTKKQILISCIIGIMISLMMLTSLYISYDLNAFNTPEFTRTLVVAPWIIDTVNKGVSQINEFGQQLKNISDSASNVFAKMDNFSSLDTQDSMIKILHISDIHNNPAALGFIENIVDSFDVNYIIDTGDITDYGTPLEDIVIKHISKLPVKYYFVEGNHDSGFTEQLFEQVENAVVLDNEAVNIEGITLLGFADPVSKSNDIKSPEFLHEAELNLQIKEWLDNNYTPDILAVHNPAITDNLAGRIPVILNGHTHRLSIKDRNGSLVINAGTTGAAGIRGLQSKDDIPYSAVVLYFQQKDGQFHLSAADTIKIYNQSIGFQVERIFF